MPIFLLIRHGENDYVKTGRLAGRLPGIILNETGKRQAEVVAQKMAGAAVQAVYSSPLERARETAEPIARVLNQEVILRPGLIEMNIGAWQGKKLKGLSRLKAWKIVQGAPSHFHFPDGESFAEAQYRICSELDGLARQHSPKDILVCVSHSDPIKLAVAYYLGLPLDLFQRLNVAPASITGLMIGESGNRLLTLNYDLSFSLPKP